jgi:hypothetical protein
MSNARARNLSYSLWSETAAGRGVATRALLVEGSNPRSRASELGAMPIHWAAGARPERRRGFFSSASSVPVARDDEDRLDCLRALLEAGAKVGDIDQAGNTALHWAARMGLAGVCKELLTKGADVEARNTAGLTPLMAAAEHVDGYRPGGAEDVLLAAGAKVDEEDRQGETALHKAVVNPGLCARLAAAGARVDHKDKRGRSALHKAVDKNRATSAGILLGHGADPSLLDKKGKAPMHLGGAGGGALRMVMASHEAEQIRGEMAEARAVPAPRARL